MLIISNQNNLNLIWTIHPIYKNKKIGINDYFEYKFRVPLVDDFNEYENSSFVKSLNLKIFNRWGNMVFETSDLDFKWDGTHRGEESPQGAYVVKYELTGFNGTIISDTDIIYLLR